LAQEAQRENEKATNTIPPRIIGAWVTEFFSGKDERRKRKQEKKKNNYRKNRASPRRN